MAVQRSGPDGRLHRSGDLRRPRQPVGWCGGGWVRCVRTLESGHGRARAPGTPRVRRPGNVGRAQRGPSARRPTGPAAEERRGTACAPQATLGRAPFGSVRRESPGTGVRAAWTSAIPWTVARPGGCRVPRAGDRATWHGPRLPGTVHARAVFHVKHSGTGRPHRGGYRAGLSVFQPRGGSRPGGYRARLSVFQPRGGSRPGGYRARPCVFQ